MMEGVREGGEYVRERGKRKRACERKRAGEGEAQMHARVRAKGGRFCSFSQPAQLEGDHADAVRTALRRTGMSE